jgi:hypothetical protein
MGRLESSRGGMTGVNRDGQSPGGQQRIDPRPKVRGYRPVGREMGQARSAEMGRPSQGQQKGWTGPARGQQRWAQAQEVSRGWGQAQGPLKDGPYPGQQSRGWARPRSAEDGPGSGD